MKRLAIIIVLLACITMSGCLVSSLYPFYKNSDKVYEQKIIGNWIDDDGDIWIIEPNKTAKKFMDAELPDSTYKVAYYEDGDTKSMLTGTLFEIKGVRYLDFTPDTDEEQMAEMTSFHYVPVHTLARVEFNRDTLLIAWFGEEWLTELFENNKIRIKHETVGMGMGYERQLLTASTEELQKFILKYGNNDKALAEILSNNTDNPTDDYYVSKLFPNKENKTNE